MEVLIVLVALAFLALPVVSLVVALAARGDRHALNARINLLAGELAALRDAVDTLRTGPAAEPGPWSRPAGAEARPQAAPPQTMSETPAEEPAAEEPAAGEPQAAVPPAEPVAFDAASPPPPPPPAPARTLADLEGAIGARWSVIVGGIAVALGAVFLVRYTIEAGLLGPRARVAAGALFSAALFAGGEWLRRRDTRLALPVVANADVPGILTGAGAIGAFATVYAAHALYGFIGPGLAFVLLTVVGLASLVLSAIHGPKLAALGVVGAYATPLLVATETPNAIALAIHVLVVTAAVMGTARLRDWLWLAMAGVAGSAGWTVVAATQSTTAQFGVAGLMLTAGMALILAATFGYDKAERPQPPADRPRDAPAVIAFGVLAFAFLAQAQQNLFLPTVPAGLIAGLVALGAAGTWPALAPAALAGAVIVLAALASIDLQLLVEPGRTNVEQFRLGLVPPDISAFLGQALALAVPAAAAATWLAWRYGAGARRAAGWLAAAAGAIAFLALVLAYLRVAPFETRPVFGAAGLALAVLFAGLTERFAALAPDDDTAPAPAAFAVAGVAALCFAIAVSLDSGWMPLAFALAALGIAWVYTWRPVRVLPWLSVAAAVIGTGTLWASLPFDPVIVGSTPFFNRLIILTGLPALALIAGGEVLRRRLDGIPAALVSAFGLAVAGLFVGLELRHWLHGGTIVAQGINLAEAAAQTLAALAFTAGLQRLGLVTAAPVYRHASTVAAAIGALWIALGLLVDQNPFFTDASVGVRPVANLLLPAYLLTGLAAAWVALASRFVRPRWFTLGFAALSGLLLFTFISLTVRHGFRGDSLAFYHGTSDAEFWTYSAAWLVAGAVVLAVGLWLDSLPVRAASGLLIALTICKVFLLDMSALSGALRALSFIGLGLSLLAIGRFYQRVLNRRAAAAPPPAAVAD
ncbi:MAG: hypothetical protein BroJett030_31140 [Alphaproteobacteria bacterium]|nr:MAG: hypothetical protein BroJett030_31140 [Alphaproteobacteria bacterium]